MCRTWRYINPCIYLLYSAVLRGSLLAVLLSLSLRSVSDVINEYYYYYYYYYSFATAVGVLISAVLRTCEVCAGLREAARSIPSGLQLVGRRDRWSRRCCGCECGVTVPSSLAVRLTVGAPRFVSGVPRTDQSFGDCVTADGR